MFVIKLVLSAKDRSLYAMVELGASQINREQQGLLQEVLLVV